LGRISEEVAAGCGWLALFSGIACMQEDPLEVDAWLELARTRFAGEGDRRGELLALSQQMIQYLVADGRLAIGRQKLPRLRELCCEQLELLDPANRIRVLFSLGMAELFFAGSFARVEKILDRALPEARQQKILESQLDLLILHSLLAIFQGRLRVGRATLEQAELCAVELSDRCLPVQALAIVGCELLFSCGDLDGFDQQRRRTEQIWGAGILQKSALGALLNFFEALARQAQGELPAAAELLETALLEGPAVFQPHLQSSLLQLRGLIAAQTGQLEAARSDCSRALELRAKTGGSLAELPNLLLAGATCLLLQDRQQAAELLERGLAKSVELAEERYRGGFYAWLALLSQRSGRPEQALEQFQQLLELLRRQQRNFFFALTPELLQELLPVVCRQSGNSEQLRELAAEWLNSGLTDDGRLIPLLKLQTLGGFHLCGAGQRFDSSEVGQTSRTILALLTVAPNRALSTEVLMGTLWPDSPTEKARNSFDTAHSRLRRVLNSRFGQQVRQDYLVLEKGVLALRNICIDSVSFCSAMDKARYQLQRQNFWQAESALWRAQQLWSGEYLAGLDLDAELPYRRAQLTQLRLEQLGELARLLRRRGACKAAIQLLQEGLVLEPTEDALVRQLLSLAQQQGEKRLARQVLENYRLALQQADYEAEEIAELTEALSPQRLNPETEYLDP
jgi:DNA-binding SARP family transcriptional activator